MDIRFEVAKKLAKPAPKAPGITLRSIKGPGEDGVCSMIIMAGDYKPVRESAAAFKMLKGCNLACRSRGRSLEIYAEGEDCIYTIMEFGLGMSFNSEDAMEVIDFFAKNVAGTELKAEAIDMTTEDLKLSCIVSAADDCDKEAVYSAYAAAAGRYDMGIIK